MQGDRKFPSVSLTRSAMLVGVPIAVLIGAHAISGAAVNLKAWSAGETLTADDLNANFTAVAAALDTPKGWFECGVLNDLNMTNKCNHVTYPTLQYEYGIAYNSAEPLVVDCTFWNKGIRVANRNPYFVTADNPTDGTMRRGGFVFYTGTNATDDDIPSPCAADGWRHTYWQESAGTIAFAGSNGCFSQKLHCRAR
jgi:hypothetical protein